MPEDVATLPAESSPAEQQPQPETAEKQETVSVPTNAEDYAEWRVSGKLPEKKQPSPENSAPSKKPVTADPEPALQNRRQGNADSRKEELNREIRELIAQRDRIRNEVQPPPAKQDVKAEPSPAQPAPDEPLGRKRPKEPNQDDFNSWSDYKKAEGEYTEKLAEYKAAQIVQEYVQSHEQKARQAAVQAKLDAAKQRYGDEAEPLIEKTGRSFFQNEKVHPSLKAAIGRSDVMVDALYVMASDPKSLESFTHLATTDPLEALREWFEVEKLVKAELNGKNGNAEPNGNTPMRAEDGKFVSAKPPARMRHAPAPPTELGGNSSPPGDERDRAAASGDVRKFFSEGNRRDLARWKGQL